MPKISIVVCCYNAAAYLDRSWGSIKNQTIGLENLECILVDDASCDDGATWEKLQEIEREAPENVMVIRSEKNGGPGGALNIGIGYATGEYLQLMDVDDELDLYAMEKLWREAKEKDADIIQYNHVLILGDTRRENKVSEGNVLYEINSKEDRYRFLNATTVTYGRTNKLYRLSLVKNAGVRFAENMVYEEPLFVYPLFLYAKRVYIYEAGLYYYYLHEGSIVTSKIGKRILDHPNVQLQLLFDLMDRGSLYEEYRDVIGCYFLWSFYCETFIFAAQHTDAAIPLEYAQLMQKICRVNFPDWRENKFVAQVSEPVKEFLNTIEKDINTQEEVTELVRLASSL